MLPDSVSQDPYSFLSLGINWCGKHQNVQKTTYSYFLLAKYIGWKV